MVLPLVSCYGATRILMLWNFSHPHVMGFFRFLMLWNNPFPIWSYPYRDVMELPESSC
jgi:hypothetical protein